MSELTFKSEIQEPQEQVQVIGEINPVLRLICKEPDRIIIPKRLHLYAPVWAKILKNNQYDITRILKTFKRTLNKTIDNFTYKKAYALRIDDSHCCIVGEKYGFSSKYVSYHFQPYGERCTVCTDLSTNLYDDVKLENYTLFNLHLDIFVNHCDKAHPV